MGWRHEDCFQRRRIACRRQPGGDGFRLGRRRVEGDPHLVQCGAGAHRLHTGRLGQGQMHGGCVVVAVQPRGMKRDRFHACLLWQTIHEFDDTGFLVTTMTTQGANADQFPFVRPAGDRAGRDVEQLGNFGSGEQLRSHWWVFR